MIDQYIISDQIRSVTQSCPTLCDPMNRNTPGLPVHHQLPEFTQTHVHRVNDAIQPSHPLSSFLNFCYSDGGPPRWSTVLWFQNLSFLLTLSLSFCSAFRKMSSTYLFIFWSFIFFCNIMYFAYKLNKQGDNIQPWHTPFPIWNQSVVPCPDLTVASWPAYKFLKRQIRWSGIPISFRIFHSWSWSTQSKALA